MKTKLTKIEKEILYYASVGRTAKLHAQKTNKSFHTINTQRRMLLKKMNCANITHACAEAIRQGYIS